jgi:hypothetical protein
VPRPSLTTAYMLLGCGYSRGDDPSWTVLRRTWDFSSLPVEITISCGDSGVIDTTGDCVSECATTAAATAVTAALITPDDNGQRTAAVCGPIAK